MEERTKEQKQAKMADQSSSMGNLPSRILIDIISRLPMKTVMAIRCVCKSLLSLVSDSHFQILHSTTAPTELMFRGWTKSSTTLCIAEYVFVDDSLTAVDTESNVVFELPNFSVPSENYCNFGATATRVEFVNSCCGLVCYKGPYGNRFAVICNPFTREFITFPCPTRMDKNVKSQGISYGLGFSPKDNVFKLLRVIYRNYVDTKSGEEKSRLVAEIYRFGERWSSWKRVANRPYVYVSLIGLKDFIFHEGALHWYCYSIGTIVTFDFDTELFGKLVTPPHTRGSTGRSLLDIGVFENCLYTAGCVGDYVDIWALKEYGQDSWIKIFSIQKIGSCEGYEPFKYLQNGEVLMFNKFGGIVCFNPDTGSVKEVDKKGHNSNRAVFIRPSLVSLKVLLGDNVKVHSVKPWYRTKAATIPPVWTSSVAVKNVVKADKGSQGCVPGSSAPRSSSEDSASPSHPTEVNEDVVLAILELQQGGADADAGSFRSQDPRPLDDRCVGQSFSGTKKLIDEIETLKAENSLMGKVMAKLKQTKKKDGTFMRFMYQQMLNANPNMSDNSNSAPRSLSEASTSTSHPTKEKVNGDVVPAILESQQGGAEAGSFRSQDPRPPKDRHVGQISEMQKLADEIATLKAEDERKGKVIETLNAENKRKGKVIETLNAENEQKGKVIETLNAENERKGKVIETLNAENERKDKVIETLSVENDRQGKAIANMRFLYQQMLSSSDDSD